MSDARPYDEAHAADGTPRPHCAALMAAVAERDLSELEAAAGAAVAELGVTFGGDGSPFRVDPVPRVIAAAEWDALAAGLEQRVRALNAFVADAYGERAIVAAGVLDAAVVDRAEGYEPELLGRLPAGCVPIAVAGLDVVRDDDGVLLVLEDNCRAPSGFGYALAARQVTDALLPVPELGRRAIDAPVRELIAGVLRDAAPPGVEDPFVVVLTDGPQNSAHWEHARLAELAGATLVTFDEVRRDGDRLVALLDGAERPVDVLYRRCDEDRMREDDGTPTALAELVAGPWLAGRLGLANALGSGVADDKLVHAHVEAFVRFYLGEEPLLRSVPTLDLGTPAAVAEVLDSIETFVVKPRGGFGGHGVVVCGHADAATIAEVREALRDDPGAYIAQRTVTLSCAPTVVDGRLEERHVDLRPFIFSGRGWTRTLPGGLTRVALDAGALVVNSSQAGGAKDTWVLA